MGKGVVRDLQKRLVEAADPVDRVEALFALGSHHAASGRNREGLRAARQALDLAHVAQDRTAAGRAFALASRCHWQLGDAVAAIASGLDALEALADGDWWLERSQALRCIALAFHALGDAQLAGDAARCAVEQAEGDARAEADARAALGAILAARGCASAARRQLRTAAAAYRQANDLLALKRCTLSLGDTYRYEANAAADGARQAEAELTWRHALRIYRVALATGADDDADGAILARIAECECRCGDVDAAYEHASMATRLAEHAQAAATVAAARLWESAALAAMSRTQAADRACAAAVDAAEASGDDALLAQCLRERARLQDLAGRFESAADLEKRSGEIAARRSERLAQARAELRPLWQRHAADAARPFG